MQAQKSFYEYFKENMEGLGLPAPSNLFGTATTAIATIQTLLTQVDKFGKAVTIADLMVAGTKLEAIGYIGACSAAFYVGACIGSLAVATGRSLSGGFAMIDVVTTANRYNLNRPWLTPTLQRYPGLYDSKVTSRSAYRYQGVVA